MLEELEWLTGLEVDVTQRVEWELEYMVEDDVVNMTSS